MGGQWWHDQVRSALSDAERKVWLTDCFEVVELHVRPAAQGHGIGSRQLRVLLAMAEGTTTLLSTPEADERASRAWRLYRGFGFIDVLRDFRFPGDERAFAVLGRELPLAERRDPAAAAERA
jgi:ribosomal protein S18 acetylase RimI-like enzyme